MERKCFIFRVKKERLHDYLKAHNVWTELLDTMRESGLLSYSLFYRPDGLIVGYMEGDNIMESLRKIDGTDVSARWEAGMAQYFEGGALDKANSTGLEWLEQYFSLL